MTKQDEIDRYAAFVASLPRNSYLADILAGTVELIETQIRNDLADPATLVDLWKAKAEASKELLETRKQIELAKRELADLQRDAARVVNQRKADLEEIRRVANRLAVAAV